MDEDSRKDSLHNIAKSKFVRTIFLQIVLTFIIVIIAVIAIAFYSFNTEINSNIIKERQMQLEAVESTFSKRMSEVSSVAYNIGNDNSFFLGKVEEERYSGYEMASILGRYLVGNDFIEHLAYYRLSEPDIIYASSGEIKIRDFFRSYLGMPDEMIDLMIEQIQTVKESGVNPILDSNGNMIYLSYICPLPQFSQNPQAYVLMLISLKEVEPLIDSQLSNCSGTTMIFDEKGQLFYQRSTLSENITVKPEEIQFLDEIKINGTRYAVLQKISPDNGWSYVTLIRMKDMISDAANKQIVFILLLLILMMIAIVVMSIGIVMKFKPINKLAMEMSEQIGTNKGRTVIDEESLLTSSIATLKDDSEQKKHFEAAFYEAEAANKAKSAFLSNMSHDIRTPMNVIVGMTEIASNNADDPGYVKECLRNVHVASQYLLDIINNVLDMSRIESGQFKLSEDEVDLPKLMSGMTTILNHNLEVKSQVLIATIHNVKNERIIGDNVRLTQVFMNILSNSVKFTPNGGTIYFNITEEEAIEEGFGDYTFRISDTGIGMPEEFVKKVFETFTREDKSSVAKVEGTGLGMAIAKNFVEMMNGTIQCESELGKGTTFTVKLHMKLAQDTVNQESREKYQDQKMLIIGDNAVICENQAEVFRSLSVDAEALLTKDVETLLLQSQNDRKYQFIIINQSDRDKSGVEILKRLTKKYPSDETTYVLAAFNMFAVAKSYAYDSGIRAFVQTPLFISTARTILDRSFELQDDVKSEIVHLQGRRVLLVEDSDINRQIACTMIKETGAEIYEATNGKEAVDAFKNHEIGFFDIILMDVQMPIMNGYEATEAIRSIQRIDANIPIYAMTANTFDEDVRQVKEAGMNGHLGKPYVSEELYRMLGQALNG